MCPDFRILEAAWSAALCNEQGSMEKEVAAQSTGLKQVASNRAGFSHCVHRWRRLCTI